MNGGSPSSRADPSRGVGIWGGLLVAVTAWVFYAVSQGDAGLAVVAGLVAVAGSVTVSRRLRGASRPLTLPWWLAGFLLSLVGGWLWRSLIGLEAGESGLALPFLGPLQSATVIAGCALAVVAPGRPRVQRALVTTAWLTVATAGTMPTVAHFAALAAFAVVNLAVIAAGWWVMAGDDPRRGVAVSTGVAVFVTAWVGSSLLVTAAVSGLKSELFDLFDQLLAPVESSLPDRTGGDLLRFGGRDPSGRNLRPVLEVSAGGDELLYLRSRVFEHYPGDDLGWRATRSEARRRLPPPKPDDETRTLLFFEPMGRIVPAPAGVVASEATAAVDEVGLIYPAQSGVRRIELAGGGETEPAVPREALLEVPESLGPLLDEMLSEIVADAAGPLAETEAIRSFFQQGFQYSLSTDLPPGQEALRLFLAERRPAYCVYFASAAALMLRRRGIPARVVGGFLAEEAERGLGGRRFVVRVSDSHAWAEALLPAGEDGGSHWVLVDATPSGERSRALAAKSGLASLLDQLRRAWGRWSARRRPGNLWRALGVVAVVVAVGWLIGRRRGAWRRSSRGESTLLAEHRLFHLYARFEAALGARLHGERSGSETDDELLARLRQETGLEPVVVKLAERFMVAYGRARFGNLASAIGDATSAVETLERETPVEIVER